MIGPPVEQLSPAEATAAAAVLVGSHASYPAFRAVFPRQRQRHRALHHFFSASLRDASELGSAWVVREGDRLSAVAVWRPPGEALWDTRRKLRASARLAMVALVAPASARRFFAYGANAERATPRERGWVLEVLGVRPDSQRGGAGSALTRLGIDRADADGLPAFLHTSDPANVAYYQRFGFEVVAEPVLVPDGPPHIAMRRAPVV